MIKNSQVNDTSLPHFSFTLLNTPEWEKSTQSYLEKWGLWNQLQHVVFAFNEDFQSYKQECFLQSFFHSDVVRKSLMVVTKNGVKSSLPKYQHGMAQPLHCTVTSLDFFERLKAHNIVRINGAISKCLDEYIDNVLVSDELRKTLLDETCETYSIFSEEDRKEFIFHLFKLVVLGGSLCQYEDEATPYFDVTKQLYKALVRVQPSGEQGQFSPRSTCFQLIEMEQETLFPFPDPRNVAFLCLDRKSRIVHFLYHENHDYY